MQIDAHRLGALDTLRELSDWFGVMRVSAPVDYQNSDFPVSYEDLITRDAAVAIAYTHLEQLKNRQAWQVWPEKIAVGAQNIARLAEKMVAGELEAAGVVFDQGEQRYVVSSDTAAYQQVVEQALESSGYEYDLNARKYLLKASASV